jgi:hypothetical protein
MSLTMTRHVLLPAGGTNPSALSDKFFSGLYTFRGGFTRYLCTSPVFMPTHRRVSYPSRRKA